VIAGKFRLAISISLIGLQIFQSAVYAGFLYLPFAKSYPPSLYVYDSYTLDKGWPTYGPKTGSPDPHTGTDYRGDGYGTPVYAAADGVVVALRETENDRCDITYAEQLRYGNYVFIEHQVGNTKYRTEYWHLKQNGVVVNVSDRVNVGTLIAYVSNSGLTRGSDCQIRKDLPYGANYHLHFEVKKWDGKRWVVVNPYNERTGWLWVGNPPLPATWYLIRKQGTATVYFIEKGKKRTIPDRDTFLALGFEWEDVHDLSAGAFNSIPTGSAIPSVSGSWVGAYFSNNSLTMPPTLIRAEAKIDMQWGSGAPSGIPKDDFSARFVRYVNFPVTETYRFHIEKDDGGRLWIDGTKIFDKWCHTSACAGHFTVDYDINTGTHLVRFDYYERGGSATARLWWDTPDKIGPQVSVDFGVEAQGGGWFTSDIPIVINASDPSGIAEIAYQVGPPRDPNGWTRVYNQNSVSLIVAGEGIHELYFNAKDKNGNWGNPEGFEVIPIDFTPPTTNFSYDGPSYEDEEGKLFISPETQFILEADDTNPTDPSIETSGVAETNYQIDESEEQIYESGFSLQDELGDGMHEIKYQSDDVAGNKEPQNTQEVYLDSTSPTSTDDSDGEWHNVDVAVVIVATADDGSGVQAIYYWINNGQEEVAEGDQVLVIFEEEGVNELSYYAVDNVENIEGEIHLALVKIDKTPPTIEGFPDRKPNENGWYNEDVIVHFKAEDQPGLSGLKSVTPDVVVSTEGRDQEVVGTAEDNAGNTASTTVGGINIDKTDPSSEITFPEEGEYYNAESWEGEVRGIARDNLSGVAEVEVEVVERLFTLLRGWSVQYKANELPDEATPAWTKSGEVTIEINPPGYLHCTDLDGTSLEYALEDDEIDSAIGITLEGRVRILGGDTLGGDYTAALEIRGEEGEGNLVPLYFYTDGIRGAGEEETYEMTTTDDYHTYRITLLNGVAKVYVDGIFRLTSSPQPSSGPNIMFSPIQGTNGESSWDYLYYRTDGAFAPGEERELEAGWGYPLKFAEDGSDDGQYTIRSWAADLAGNQESTDEVIFIYDTTPPVTSAEVSGKEGLNGWYQSNIRVALSATDNLSPIVKTEYQLDPGLEGVWVEGTTVEVTGDGEHQLFYRSQDAAGNIADLVSYPGSPIKIDTVRPHVDKFYLADQPSANQSFTNYVDVGVFIEDWDNVSGVSGWYVSEDNSPPVVSDFADSRLATFAFSNGDGSKLLYVRVRDLAGNISEVASASIILDTVAPVTSVSLSGLMGLNGWYVSPVELNFKALDETSGIKRIFVSINDNIHTILYEDNEGGEGTVLSKLPFEEDGVYAVRFWSEDLARNIEQEQEVTFKINTTPPTVPAGSIPSGTFTEGEALVVGLTTEEGVKIYYSLNGGGYTLYSGPVIINDDTTISAYTVDDAGNRSASVEFNYVFNPAPQVLGAQSQETPGVSQGGDPVGDVAGVKGEEGATTGEPNPKGLGVWPIPLVVMLGGVSYLLRRRRGLSRR